MKLIGLTIENFRCYAAPINVRLGNLTAFVGRNDVGKSTLMDALAIFFGTASPDKDDACKSGDPSLMRITCEFDTLPETLVVDTEFPTTLAAEHLLSSKGTLLIRRTFNGNLDKPKETSIDAIAEHPTIEGFHDLLTLKKADLSKRAVDLGVSLDGVDKRVNALVRAAIWNACGDLKCTSTAVSLGAEGGKQVWTALQPYLPSFALFKSDRASTDQDAEAQDPLKAAIKEAIKVVEPKLQEITDYVTQEVTKIATDTVNKLREMDPSIADSLNPIITPKSWDSLFKTSITGDEGIPLNKRGSGVRRLVLLNFFRAQAEKEAIKNNANSVIYAIEEPETSQHPRNQRLLLNALRELADGDGRQIIITTHTPMLARYLPETDLRFIQRGEDGVRTIKEGSDKTSREIAESLGVLPDHNVKIFIGVEGAHDVSFLKGIAQVLIAGGEDVPNLEKLEMDGALIFFPFGGSNLALWASRLKALNRPEFHICDRDTQPPAQPRYHEHMEQVNSRDGCYAVATSKREMENYLHPEAIREAYATDGHHIQFPETFADFSDVPAIVAEIVSRYTGGEAWENQSSKKQDEKIKRAKRILNNSAVNKMTAARLTETDPDNEIRGWLERIKQMMADVDS